MSKASLNELERQQEDIDRSEPNIWLTVFGMALGMAIFMALLVAALVVIGRWV